MNIEHVQVNGARIGVSFHCRYRDVNSYHIHLSSHRGALCVELRDDASVYRCDTMPISTADALAAVAEYERRCWAGAQKWASDNGYSLDGQAAHAICAC